MIPIETLDNFLELLLKSGIIINFYLFINLCQSNKGIHPHDAKTWTDDCWETIKELASNPECVAIGECGLDFNRNFSPPDVQLAVFEKQVSTIFTESLSSCRNCLFSEGNPTMNL